MSSRSGEHGVSSALRSEGSQQAARTARRGWVHFGVAAGILLIAAVGWNGAMAVLKWTMVKYPAPWPEGLEVLEHRLVNFPAKLGPFVLAGDGELAGQKDGRPDGIRILNDEMIENLGVAAHELNWYCMAQYRDTRLPDANGEHGARYVRLDITYYTGLLDVVPHEPGRCLEAAGYRVLPDRSGPMSFSVDDAETSGKLPPSWRKFDLNRVFGAKGQSHAVEYYFFSMNGEPTAHREVVRGKLTLPWVRYCYFAKVQLAVLRASSSPGRITLGYETDLEFSDRICREFLAHALPEVLRFVPTADDIEKLKASGGS